MGWQYWWLAFYVFEDSIEAMKCLLLLAVFPIVFGISCATPQDRVDVSIYHLKNLSPEDKDNPTVRSEQQKRLYGAVSLKERQSRMGQYYTVRWDVSEKPIDTPVSIVFRYRQAATGSKLLKQEHKMKSKVQKGITEFSITGDAYQKLGRVLNWRIEVYSGSKLQASEQSYLWE